jgi:hypothetical protein
MPIHDWARVDADIFHHFHHAWISELSRALNRGLLPPDYYALSEQVAGGLRPDVLTLQRPENGAGVAGAHAGGVALAVTPPKVHLRLRAEMDLYASKADRIVIRHISQHDIVAILEVVSPEYKSSRHGLRAFVEKADMFLRKGIHLVVLDLFPPGPRDLQGMHKAIWDEIIDNDFALPADKRLTLASYIAGAVPEAFVEPTAVGLSLTEMPLFLKPEIYVPLPLEQTYQSAWEAVPSYWRDFLTSPVPSP